MADPVIRGVHSVLVHVPGLVRYGSKPTRELAKEGDPLLSKINEHVRSFEEAVGYAPNQVFIGNLSPEQLEALERPWWSRRVGHGRFGPFGQIMPEEEFLALMSLVDEFDLLRLLPEHQELFRAALARNPLFASADLSRLNQPRSAEQIRRDIETRQALPIYSRDGDILGCMCRGHPEDASQEAAILLENLACKASGVLALLSLLAAPDAPAPQDIEYVVNCGEEAVGDRYQRGAGSLSKAMAEASGLTNATGSDCKAFCCAPIHALVSAGAMVQAGVFKEVVVVGGGSVPKLGMKMRGHLAKGMPLLEDVLAAIAIEVAVDDGVSPRLRLDSVGWHTVGAGSAMHQIVQATVGKPLDRLGYRLTDVDKFAVELHNPEVTEPAGSGNVPLTNYRMLAQLAVMRGEIDESQVDEFVRTRGLVGFSPTQGHIPAGIPFLPHACRQLQLGQMTRAMFIAKGSLFLAKMTNLSDGMSVLLERNNGEVAGDADRG